MNFDEIQDTIAMRAHEAGTDAAGQSERDFLRFVGELIATHRAKNCFGPLVGHASRALYAVARALPSGGGDLAIMRSRRPALDAACRAFDVAAFYARTEI